MTSKKLNPQVMASFVQREEKFGKVSASRIPGPVQRTSSDEDEKGQPEKEKRPPSMANFFPKTQPTKDSKNEARKKAVQNFLRVDSDDDLGSASSIPAISEHSSDTSTANMQRHAPLTKPRDTTTPSSQPSLLPEGANISMMMGLSIPEHTGGGVGGMMRPLSGEARIVAPNVSKLSPHSAVEVRLQSSTESVAVLCSVDVLKMRSGFFHDILNEQEKSIASRTIGPNTVPLNHSMQSNILWREAIVIPETTPFEAAAFLESLHEGRTLFRGEWNYCWAKLSVTWVIEELILEYANQIEEHMNKVVGMIQSQHWRTNPSVLAGMRISVFRKGSNPIPTVVTGTIVESPPNIGYSKIRVLFDNERAVKNVAASNIHPAAATATSSLISPASSTSTSSMETLNMNMNMVMDLQSPSLTKPLHGSTGPFTPYMPPLQHNITMLASMNVTENPNQIVGDVSEPLWVQSPREGSVWCDPDDLFMMEAKRFLTITDKRMFWEMARALLDFPEMSLACKTGIRNAHDLTTTLKRPEFRALWTLEAADFLPKEMASELIRSAYCPVITENNHGMKS